MSLQRPTYDCLLVGGGVIGLSLAWELARLGRRVCVLDRGEPGQEASWAGAGILPPGSTSPKARPLARLIAQSSLLHAAWASRLFEETGIDTGYRRCGGVYVARTADDLERIEQDAARLGELGVEFQWLSQDQLTRLAETLGAPVAGGYFLPAEAQLRNPRHIQALLAAAAQRGVTILPRTPAERLRVRGDRIEAVDTPDGPILAADYCLTAGCWTSEWTRQMDLRAEIKPIRGQIVLLRSQRPLFENVINDGLRYLVPRDDGRILVGSTMEDVGFDAATTAHGIRGLLEFALGLAPRLADCAVEKTWAGLRPATADGLPILGRVPHVQNAWIASGHFRNGLTLSTATAENVARLICGLEPTIDLTPFSPGRFAEDTAAGRRPRPLATHGA